MAAFTHFSEPYVEPIAELLSKTPITIGFMINTHITIVVMGHYKATNFTGKKPHNSTYTHIIPHIIQ
jgi:hypothetical protein